MTAEEQTEIQGMIQTAIAGERERAASDMRELVQALEQDPSFMGAMGNRIIRGCLELLLQLLYRRIDAVPCPIDASNHR